MGNFLFSLAEVAAVIVFIVALAQGKGFGNAVRAGIGVLILGFVAVLALGLLFGLIQLAAGLAMVALWIVAIYAIVVVIARFFRSGNPAL